MASIIIFAHGMGHSAKGDCYAWASTLFPDSEQFEQDTRRWLQLPDGNQVYLLEVFYEDANEAFSIKYTDLWGKVLGKVPDAWRDPVSTCITDVAQAVLSDASIDQVQTRFVYKYLEARALAQALVGPEGNPRSVPIIVIGHSLGTLIVYEGLYRASAVAAKMPLHPVRVVVCAPMWSPIRKVQAQLARRRYLVTEGLKKPGRMNTATQRFEALISRCTAVYHSSDPFLLIQERSEYQAGGAGNGLIDEFVVVDSGSIPLPASHNMGSAYLGNDVSRSVVLRGAFG